MMGQHNQASEYLGSTEVSSGEFCGEMLLETSQGRRAVSALKTGDKLHTISGQCVRVVGIRSGIENSHCISLPGTSIAQSVIVSINQLMHCQHFLCSALFGRPDTYFSAGDVTGPSVCILRGIGRQFYRLVLETTAIIPVGGYEFVFLSNYLANGREDKSRWPEIGCIAAVDSSIGELWNEDLRTNALLRADQVKQICDAGILFRKAAKL